MSKSFSWVLIVGDCLLFFHFSSAFASSPANDSTNTSRGKWCVLVQKAKTQNSDQDLSNFQPKAQYVQLSHFLWHENLALQQPYSIPVNTMKPCLISTRMKHQKVSNVTHLGSHNMRQAIPSSLRPKVQDCDVWLNSSRDHTTNGKP